MFTLNIEMFATRLLHLKAAEMGLDLAQAQPLAGDGSDRRFYRFLGSPTRVLLWHPGAPGLTVNENDSYFQIGRHLAAKGVPVPEIYYYCQEEGWMFLEDLGDVSLQAALQGRPQQVDYWYRQALKVLVGMQLRGLEGFDPAWCFDTPQMDGAFLWEREAGYFVQAFLNKYKGLKVQVEDLEPDFERLVAGALPAGLPFFLHRDYQSRNLFLKNGQLRVIDFQGARLGPVGYDLAALLIDPYVKLNRAQQGELLSHYLDLLRERISVNEAAFREQYYHLALSRNLQILGAFGFLTKVKGKTAFAQYIPAALASLQERLAERPEEFPRLAQAVKSLS